MELLFVTIGGAILGAIARYVLPHRQVYGTVVLPAIGCVVAAIVWVALTWAGWKWDGGWIWLVSLAAAALVSAGTALFIGPRRVKADALAFEKLAAP